MIQKFVDAFMANQEAIRAEFTKHPDDYQEVVRAVIKHIAVEDYTGPDSERIHEIDDGSYRGTLVYVIGAKGYQPYDYWYVRVAYGSCSVCDTLHGIRGYSDDPPTEDQVDQYMTLALHIVQWLKKMDDVTVNDEFDQGDI